MSQHKTIYGPVTIEKNEEAPATITFPAQNQMTVNESEIFWGHLMDAITLARELDGDPI